MAGLVVGLVACNWHTSPETQAVGHGVLPDLDTAEPENESDSHCVGHADKAVTRCTGTSTKAYLSYAQLGKGQKASSEAGFRLSGFLINETGQRFSRCYPLSFSLSRAQSL